MLKTLLFGGVLTLVPCLGSAANRTTFSGQAAVVHVEVPLLGVDQTIIHAGPLPATGGSEHDHLLALTYPAPGLPDPTGGAVALQAEVLHAATVGQGKASRAEASVATLSLTVAGHTISADFLTVRATAQCQAGSAAVSGNSQVANLVVDGKRIVGVEFPANTEIGLVDALGLPVGRVVINEQNSSASGDTGDISVSALHVEVFGVADVVISHAHADINCAGFEPGGDFVTGGGWITATPSGIPGTFGVAGGIKNGAFWGHLTYIDHGSRMHVKGTGVTGYIVTGTTSRRIFGTCQVNGQAGFTYQVDVDDKGEPGGNDLFFIVVSNGYAAGGDLGGNAPGGGNIQLHN
jgi:hypothetical protein